MNLTRSLPARLLVSLSIIAIVGACEGSPPLVPKAETASGAWQSSNEVTGSSERWVLTVADGAITGVGDWSGANGCPGSLKIAGVARGDSLRLNVDYDIDCPEGRLVFRNGDYIYAVLSAPRDLTGTRIIRTSSYTGFASIGVIDVVIHPVHFQRVDR